MPSHVFEGIHEKSGTLRDVMMWFEISSTNIVDQHTVSSVLNPFLQQTLNYLLCNISCRTYSQVLIRPYPLWCELINKEEKRSDPPLRNHFIRRFRWQLLVNSKFCSSKP